MSITSENGRAHCEFDPSTRAEALRRAKYRCELCGADTFTIELTLHHIIGVWIARRYFPELSAEYLRSLANAQVLCRKCHDQVEKTMFSAFPGLALPILEVINVYWQKRIASYPTVSPDAKAKAKKIRNAHLKKLGVGRRSSGRWTYPRSVESYIWPEIDEVFGIFCETEQGNF